MKGILVRFKKNFGEIKKDAIGFFVDHKRAIIPWDFLNVDTEMYPCYDMSVSVRGEIRISPEGSSCYWEPTQKNKLTYKEKKILKDFCTKTSTKIQLVKSAKNIPQE